MILDSKLELARAQALTSSGASTDHIKLDAVQQIGLGEPIAVQFVVTTAADFTTGNETYTFAVQTDDNTSFSSATTLNSVTLTAAELTAGKMFWLFVGATNEQYLRAYMTLGGTTPSVSLTIHVTPFKMIDTGSGKVYYPSGYDVD